MNQPNIDEYISPNSPFHGLARFWAFAPASNKKKDTKKNKQ
jgi:hypothetical protein